MASKTSKGLTVAALIAVIGLGLLEAYTGVNVPLEEMMPMLVAVGVTGAGLSAVKAVAEGKAISAPLIKKYVDEILKAQQVKRSDQ